MLRTPFCDLFGVEYPILNAPMTSYAGHALAAAVSNAGGLGLIGGSVHDPKRDPDDVLRQEIRACRALTDRPFGIGFISTPNIAPTIPDSGRLQAVALDEGVTIIAHSFLVPDDLIVEAKRRGAQVIVQSQTLALAKQAMAAGVDAIVAQGYDAGGHTGEIGTMSIVPAVVDVAGNVPVIAAGGIADGRGLAAALMLGAQGGWIGTRFYLSQEAVAARFQQEAMLAACTDDTIWTLSYDVVRDQSYGPMIGNRVLRNTFTDVWHGRDAEVKANAERLVAEINRARDAGDASMASILCGSGVGLVRNVEPAGAVLRQICAEAEQVIRARAAAVLA